MQYAVSAPNVGEPAWLVELASAADRAAWDAFFLWDHVHRSGTRTERRRPVGDARRRARETERVRLGTMVTRLPRRRPWKLAKEIVTLHHLSGGRVVVGVGLGEPAADEFAAVGRSRPRSCGAS